MNLSRSAIVVLAPALFISVLYWLLAPAVPSIGGSVNPQHDLRVVKSQLDAIQNRSVPPEVLDRESSEVAANRDSLITLRKQKNQLEEQWTALRSRMNSAVPHTELLVQVEKLLTRHGLHHLQQSAPRGESRVSIAPDLKAVMDKMSDNKQTTGQMVEIRFLGRYIDVMKAVDDLSGRGWRAFPIGLSMSEADIDGEWRHWSLLLWI